jgi:hypothetical protein
VGDNITTYLFTQGVLGVACVILGIVCTKLYNKTERQQTRIEELQELRLQDSKDISKDIAAVLEGNSQSNRILAEKIEIAKDARRS